MIGVSPDWGDDTTWSSQPEDPDSTAYFPVYRGPPIDFRNRHQRRKDKALKKRKKPYGKKRY